MGLSKLNYLIAFSTILLSLKINAFESEEQPKFGPAEDEDVSKRIINKRQAGRNPLNKAWEEALPGVQPFWEKYSTGPYGVVIRGWQFSRCASEQVKSFIFIKKC